ncbi:MAG: LLM class flavin-dependent oxidoreductase [Anaerolineae bacterium]|nr:LLM class flavin-dependent oxidoreductase [Anaerolineae bacterium]
MRWGLNLPNVGACSDPRVLADVAYEAEQAGWDGAFVWDSLCAEMKDPPNQHVCDPWIALAAMAMRTERILLGPIITPITRRRPWKLARETVSLDHLSRGRLVLPVGLGAVDEGAFARVNEERDRKLRAERTDEGLEILTGLWSGEPYSFQGEHYQVDTMTFLPTPVQSSRIPIWVVGAWPRMKSMRRAVRYDGILPTVMNDKGEHSMPTPDQIREMKTYIDTNRTLTTPFDIVLEAEIPGDDPAKAAAIVRPYAEVGVTWWLESVWWATYRTPGNLDAILSRIRQGPPKL